MADEPTKADIAKLEAQIKELTQRSKDLDADVDATHKAAEEAKKAAAAQAKELGGLKPPK